MAREEDLDDYTVATRPTNHEPPSRHDSLIYLPFDRVEYRRPEVPCQGLVATYYATGVKYYLTVNDVDVYVPKKQVQQLLFEGTRVWVSDPSPTSTFGRAFGSVQISVCKEPALYRPTLTYRMRSPQDAASFGQLASFLSFSFKKRRFYYDDETGRSSNALRPSLHRGEWL